MKARNRFDKSNTTKQSKMRGLWSTATSTASPGISLVPSPARPSTSAFSASIIRPPSSRPSKIFVLSPSYWRRRTAMIRFVCLQNALDHYVGSLGGRRLEICGDGVGSIIPNYIFDCLLSQHRVDSPSSSHPLRRSRSHRFAISARKFEQHCRVPATSNQLNVEVSHSITVDGFLRIGFNLQKKKL